MYIARTSIEGQIHEQGHRPVAAGRVTRRSERGEASPWRAAVGEATRPHVPRSFVSAVLGEVAYALRDSADGTRAAQTGPRKDSPWNDGL